MSVKNVNKLFQRMPISFGPFPGPRQTTRSLGRNGSKSTSIEAVVTMKVARTQLQGLLPPGFRFQVSGADSAYVSVSAKSLENLEWLGDRGYNLLSYYIHGVEYSAADGTTYRGTYLPVLWEDLADPIISGREELGYPKLFADLSINRTTSSYKMAASWHGFTFAGLELSELRDRKVGDFRGIAPPDAGIDEGLLLYKCIPATGEPGVSAIAHPVWVSYTGESAMQLSVTTKLMQTDRCTVHWSPGNWKQLPTLHHIISSLDSINPISVVGATLIEKRGLSDLSSASKI